MIVHQGLALSGEYFREVLSNGDVVSMHPVKEALVNRSNIFMTATYTLSRACKVNGEYVSHGYFTHLNDRDLAILVNAYNNLRPKP